MFSQPLIKMTLEEFIVYVSKCAFKDLKETLQVLRDFTPTGIEQHVQHEYALISSKAVLVRSLLSQYDQILKTPCGVLNFTHELED